MQDTDDAASHLRVALAQSLPTDDQIIVGHMRDALNILETADREFYNPMRQVMFRAGLLACREYMARFVESESPSIAASIRANWWPFLGDDPGKPRKLRFDEVTGGGEEGPWTAKEIHPSIEALPVASAFLFHAATKGGEVKAEGAI